MITTEEPRTCSTIQLLGLAAGPERGRSWQDAGWYNRLAVATIKPALQMDRMECLAQLARARAAIGEIEHACQTAVEAALAVRRRDSAYTRQQLTDGGLSLG